LAEFVRDVNMEADRREYMEEKAREERRMAMLRPPVVKSIEDFDKVIESLKKYGQRSHLIECEEERCTVYGVNEILIDREAEKVTMEVDSGDYEKKFFLELQNVMDVSARKPTRFTDVIYERRYGGEWPLERYPYYVVGIIEDRGVCHVHWETRGAYRKESPYRKQGFEISCYEMTVDELVEKMRHMVMRSAVWRLKKKPEEITEEELREVAETIIAEWKRCKTI